ncbi:beta-galactosidase trimerization domain-containing protein [Schaalia vaccimaxillae]|uniref:beta-galactosidase trimerization domain-containing protein n=1 Tax=Schaalia vaccimaxillae TaxID=183916 RepID=UPI0003B4ED33|nr:beta-galactosidase trimerization domain-containing protein [Schaalia vaccimaxillae]
MAHTAPQAFWPLTIHSCQGNDELRFEDDIVLEPTSLDLDSSLIVEAQVDPADPATAHSLAWIGDRTRGQRGGLRWLVKFPSPPARPGQRLLWTMALIARGTDGVLIPQVAQNDGAVILGGAEAHADSANLSAAAGTVAKSVASESARTASRRVLGMIPPDSVSEVGRVSRSWRETVDLVRALARLGSVEGQTYEADVAIVVDSDSARHQERAQAWHRTLWEAGFATDIVARDAGLDGYKLVIVPAVAVDDPVFARNLARAVEAGSQILVEGPTGTVSPEGKTVRGGYLGSLKTLLGVRVVGCTASADHPARSAWADDASAVLVNRLTRAVGTPAAQTWIGLTSDSSPLLRALDAIATPMPDLRAGTWVEDILPVGHGIDPDDPNPLWPANIDIVATYDGRGAGADLAGRPAVTRRRSDTGGGAAWYAACDLNAVSRAALVRVLAAHARLQPVLAELPDGVEAQRRGNILFLLNHGDKARELSGISGTDLMSGAECTGHVLLAPRSALVVAQTRTVQ